MLNVKNEQGATLEIYGGYPVKQHRNNKIGRWYVHLPIHSGLRELFGCRRMIRSHYVFLRYSGLNKVPKSFVIHHANHDRENDEYDNLEMVGIADHNTYHKNDLRENPRKSAFLGKKHSDETLVKMSESAIARGNNGIWEGAKKEHFESTKLLMREKATGAKNAMYRHDLDNEAIARCYQKTGSLEATSKIFGCSVQAIRNRVNQRKAQVDWKTLPDQKLLEEFVRCGKNIHKTSMVIDAPSTSLWRKLKKIGALDA